MVAIKTAQPFGARVAVNIIRRMAAEVTELLEEEHPCNARALGFQLVKELGAAADMIEVLHQEVRKAHLLVMEMSVAVGQPQHSGKNQWWDYEIPILHDPKWGIPPSVKYLEDNDDNTWTRIGTQDRWRRHDWDDDGVKEEGYITVERILADDQTWVRGIADGKDYDPLIFDMKDPAPDPPSFPLLKSLDLDIEFQFSYHFMDAVWVCQNQPEDQVKSYFGGDTALEWYDIIRRTRMQEVVQ